MSSTPSTPIFWVGLDVHKDSVTAAVFQDRDTQPLRVDRLPTDPGKLRRWFQRLRADGEVRACYEASGAGYVLQRSLEEWGIECHLAAPSLILRRPGDRRKTDHREAIKLGQDFRDGRLALIHIPTEEEERVRDVVRCRETFQREILKFLATTSLKFMRRGKLHLFEKGTHLDYAPSSTGSRQNFLVGPAPLTAEDRCVLTEYLALLEYKLQRRDEFTRPAHRGARPPASLKARG